MARVSKTGSVMLTTVIWRGVFPTVYAPAHAGKRRGEDCREVQRADQAHGGPVDDRGIGRGPFRGVRDDAQTRIVNHHLPVADRCWSWLDGAQDEVLVLADVQALLVAVGREGDVPGAVRPFR